MKDENSKPKDRAFHHDLGTRNPNLTTASERRWYADGKHNKKLPFTARSKKQARRKTKLQATRCLEEVRTVTVLE